MGTTGFTKHVPEHWNKWWVAMWLLVTPAVILSAFVLPFLVWIVLALVGFLLPEMVSIGKKDDSLPPLTHTIRHFLPNWLAFPLIYFALGSVGAHWLQFANPPAIGALMGLLGWLTDHFTATYGKPDPFPYSGGPQQIEAESMRVPS